MVWFIASAVMLDRVVIFQLNVSSIAWLNMVCKPLNCASIAGWIPSSSMSSRVLNKAVWLKLRGVSVSSVASGSGVGLTLLVIVLSLVWESILVIRVVRLVGGSVDESKICPSCVTGQSEGG